MTVGFIVSAGSALILLVVLIWAIVSGWGAKVIAAFGRGFRNALGMFTGGGR
jgi:hypothetical protein